MINRAYIFNTLNIESTRNWELPNTIDSMSILF